MPVWNTTFMSEPTDEDPVSNGNEAIVELKEAIYERLVRELFMDSAGVVPAKDGWLRLGASKVYHSETEPVKRPDGLTSLDADDKGRLWYKPAAGSVLATLYVWSGSEWVRLTDTYTYAEAATASTVPIRNTTGQLKTADIGEDDTDGTLVANKTYVDTKDATKQNIITGAASTVTTTDLAVDKALISGVDGKIAVSAVTSTELAHVGGVTSAIQTQLNAKITFSFSFQGVTQTPVGRDVVGGIVSVVYAPFGNSYVPSGDGRYAIIGMMSAANHPWTSAVYTAGTLLGSTGELVNVGVVWMRVE